MPHDYNENIIKVGDLVWIPCRVKEVHMTEEYCNINVQTIHKMPPENKYVNDYTLNTKQVRKDCGDFPKPYSELKK